ncbi:MAG: hypothetical protein GY903_03840 [Fuerstiella sp.]|nr:hypothetical protein [Fuerstiella sp.]MCP4853606.1 hypothetical protein [Fuerstiella sp.]
MTLTSKERVSSALRGEPIGRFPTGPLAVHFCAGLIGASLREYTLSAATLSRAVCHYAEQFDADAVWVSADTWVTAEAMGAPVTVAEADQPLSGNGVPGIKSADDVAAIPTPDVTRHGRYPLMTEAIRRVREGVGDDRFIVACFDQYPFSAACALMGVERAMLAPLDNPGLLQNVMRKAADYAVAYGKSLADAGADMLSAGDSPAGLLGPTAYEEIAAPFEREVIGRLKEETGLPVSLHICGDSNRLLTAMTQTGADVLELDHKVCVADAIRICGPDIAIWGNLDPVGTILSSTPEEVGETTTQVLKQVRESGHLRYVASSGCTLAVGTPQENVRAFLAAAGDLHRVNN